jgi:hypothetical protein
MDTDEENKEAQTLGGNGTPREIREMEDVIELEDVVEEPFGEDPPDHAGLNSEPDQAVSLHADTPDEEDIIELVDEAADESESEDEGVIELTDVAQEEDLQPETGELSELSSADLGSGASDEDSFTEDVGMEMPAEASPGIRMSEEPAGDIGEAQDLQESGSDRELESTILERVSDEQIEAIMTRVAKEIIERKADRVLLEVAEAAIAKEIERLKQAL